MEGTARRMRGIASWNRSIFADHAIDNTVVIVPVNSGMLHLSENMRCSLSRTSFDPSQIVYWALDRGVEKELRAKGLTTYYDSSLWGVSDNQNNNGGTDSYRKMMKQRPQFYVDILSAGYDILMIDADIVFWQSPLLMVPKLADRDAVDIVYSTDARDYYSAVNAFEDPRRKGDLMPPICNGLFWMKSKPATIGLWTRMMDVFEGTSKEMEDIRNNGFDDDQRGMDVLLNDGRAKVVGPYPTGLRQDQLPDYDQGRVNITVQLLDQTEYANGQLFMFKEDEYDKGLAGLKVSGRDRVAVHMNWNTYEISKDDGSIQKGIYYLDDDGNCKLS